MSINILKKKEVFSTNTKTWRKIIYCKIHLKQALSEHKAEK